MLSLTKEGDSSDPRTQNRCLEMFASIAGLVKAVLDSVIYLEGISSKPLLQQPLISFPFTDPGYFNYIYI